MAAQDLQIQRRSSSSREAYYGGQQNFAPNDGFSRPPLLVSALRHRWWMFLLIACVSGLAAYQAVLQFGKDSSLSTASLLYTGLPGSPSGGDVFHSLGPGTCAEIMTSYSVLNELIDSRDLPLSATVLAKMITTSTSRSSSLLKVEFSWSNAENGVAMLNELIDIFVEKIALQRKNTLRGHIQHVETALLKARAEVADARQQIHQIQLQRQQLVEEGGLNNERYHSILSGISHTQLEIDEKNADQLGVLQQIEAIQQKSTAIELQSAEILRDIKTQLVHTATTRLNRMRDQFTESSSAYADASAMLAAVAAITKSDDAPTDIQQLKSAIYFLFTESRLPFSEEDLSEISEAFEAAIIALEPSWKKVETNRQQLANQREQLELSVIPLKNQIKMLENRLADFQKQSEEIGEQLTGVGADEFGAYELRLEQAESQQKALSMQLNNMSQLEKSRVREWTIEVPASLETTQESSNRAKIALFTFGLCAFALSLPVLASEWHRQQTSPQVAFANSLQIPVLAERIMRDFSPRKRHRMTVSKLTDEQLEVLRMLALRIQQSSHRSGSVVLFSSIDPQYSAAPLMAAVAECLSEREERILIVDAVCPKKTDMPITNVVALPDRQNLPAPPKSQARKAGRELATQPGLAEYLTNECTTVADLIRPTGCPGIDIISSGHTAFPREAMASSSLTELVEGCRENYTMILVNSPAATASTDLQMLTARADGVVLTATKDVNKVQSAREAVMDLNELGAPIIGLVA